MTPEMEERIRENYRKNFLALILFPREMMEAEIKEWENEKALLKGRKVQSDDSMSVDPGMQKPRD